MRCRKTIRLKARSKMGQPITVPCGQCLECRLNKRDRWACRVLLESQSSITAQFWTLTFSDTGLTAFQDKGPKKLYTNFLNALRQREQRHGNATPVRSFGVLEYGSQWDRPHFHVALYNHQIHHFDEQPYIEGLPRVHYHIGCWPHGHVDIMPLNTKSARYLAKYTTKFNLTTNKNPALEPMCFHAQRPPLGSNGLINHMDEIRRSPRRHWVQRPSIEIDGKRWELDQTMQRIWRSYCRKHRLKTDQLLTEKQARMVETLWNDFIEPETHKLSRVKKEVAKDHFYQMADALYQHKQDAKFASLLQQAAALKKRDIIARAHHGN